MGSQHSSEASSHGNSQQPTPVNSNADLLAALSSLSLSGDNFPELIPTTTSATTTTSTNNSEPPSLAAAAAIAARHRLLEELQNIAQQRIIDDLTINYNLNNYPSTSDSNHQNSGVATNFLSTEDGDDSEVLRHATFHLGLEGNDSSSNLMTPNDSLNYVYREDEGAEEDTEEEEDEEVEEPLSLLQQVQHLLLGGQVCVFFVGSTKKINTFQILHIFKSSFFVIHFLKLKCHHTKFFFLFLFVS